MRKGDATSSGKLGGLENRPTESETDIRSSKDSLVDSAAELLREGILDLSLKPGYRLNDRLLASKHDLSRTPTREAINRLASEGLIEIRSNLGAYVAPLDLSHVSELVEAYIISERTVGFLCKMNHPGLLDELIRIQENYSKVQAERSLREMTKANSAFHTNLAAATENRFVFASATRLYNISRRISYYCYLFEGQTSENFATRAKMVDEHHGLIIDCVRESDRDRLIKVLTDHCLLFNERVRDIFADIKGKDFPVDWLAEQQS